MEQDSRWQEYYQALCVDKGVSLMASENIRHAVRDSILGGASVAEVLIALEINRESLMGQINLRD